MRDEFQIKLGGDQVSLLYDRWMANGPIYSQVPFVNIQDVDLCVRDVVSLHGWNLSGLVTMLSP